MKKVLLDPTKQSDKVVELRAKMERQVVGQSRAITAILESYQRYLAGLAAPGQPIGNFLFLGPTGSGKTHVVESFAEALYGVPNKVIKVDCGEFQMGHEIAKLIGSPPGYLGHRETHAMLSNGRLLEHQTPEVAINIVLFDEIEKASDTLWNLLLGILDKAILTLGDNTKTDFSKTLVFLTGNVGARQIQDKLGPSLGFTPAPANFDVTTVGEGAARKKFTPEFFNRLENIVTFTPLTQEQLVVIAGRELNKVVDRLVIKGSTARTDVVSVAFTPGVFEFFAEKGYDPRYGARPLVKQIKKLFSLPLANLLASNQLSDAERLVVSVEGDGLVFEKEFYEEEQEILKAA